MALSSPQRLVLYLFGRCSEVLSKRFNQVLVPLSKAAFIEMVLESGLVDKSERALYKNLEVLEKKGFLSYENRFLRFSRKGEVEFISLKKLVYPFLEAETFLELIQTKRDIQTLLEA